MCMALFFNCHLSFVIAVIILWDKHLLVLIKMLTFAML